MYHSTLGLRVIKKKKELEPKSAILKQHEDILTETDLLTSDLVPLQMAKTGAGDDSEAARGAPDRAGVAPLVGGLLRADYCHGRRGCRVQAVVLRGRVVLPRRVQVTPKPYTPKPVLRKFFPQNIPVYAGTTCRRTRQ